MEYLDFPLIQGFIFLRKNGGTLRSIPPTLMAFINIICEKTSQNVTFYKKFIRSLSLFTFPLEN